MASLVAAMLLIPSSVLALRCGQPVSAGAKPTASDALATLKAGVGGAQCDQQPCICDVDNNGDIAASDALRVLNAAVGKEELGACCESQAPGCTAFAISTTSASRLDQGTTGLAHDLQLPASELTTVEVLRRCSNDQSICDDDEDCDEGSCLATCDCFDDSTCDVAGPAEQRHCVATLDACQTNADCSAGVSCVAMFLPPLALSAGGNPVCVVSPFHSEVTGEIDTETGDVSLSATIRERVYLGIAIDQPCPRCGAPESEPKLGDEFTCEGGQQPGAACTVDAVGVFGGTSFDCAPSGSSSIIGNGVVVPIPTLTTGTIEKTAALPCADFSFQSHPSRGNAKCIDAISMEDPLCTSNADCRRCTGDVSIACSGNDDCTGAGVCAEAPAQPVTCGYWCHCGFCDDDPSRPCFSDSECPGEQECVAGTGNSAQPNAPQRRPNDCSLDKFLCGAEEEEVCATTQTGHCQLQPWRACNDDEVCQATESGTCVLEPRQCFGPSISRQGATSPLGSYCRGSGEPCSGPGDCDDGDACVDDSLAPELASIGCLPAHPSATLNAGFGITGPFAFSLETFVEVCRCGDANRGCNEECDDGNFADGDGCNAHCRDE
ncbi:MAG TPA: hypothetical protein VEL28_00620 [Candidatus Binatia bacterium]|nr:hypothetical protein [Candidatus Binatia bacterium]